jgi:site-specific DNA-methyltransferase (adenine-specific)
MQNTLFETKEETKTADVKAVNVQRLVSKPLLLHGDCLQLLQDLQAGSIDLVVTDPPYFMPATHYSVRSGSSRSLSDLGILEHFFFSVMKELDRVLTQDGHAYFFCDGQSYPILYATAYPFFKSLRPLIWDKQVSINGYGWRHQHELILFCQRPDAKPIKTGDGDVLKCRAVPIKDRQHLAEKPVELLEKLIRKCSPVTVLDPFMGSAATGEAAKLCGANFIGCEKDHNYYQIATRRIEAC